jgi:predicted dehydrogenase
MLRVALVGTGDAGRHHARALANLAAEEHLAWTAVCARDATGVARFRAELGVDERIAEGRTGAP